MSVLCSCRIFRRSPLESLESVAGLAFARSEAERAGNHRTRMSIVKLGLKYWLSAWVCLGCCSGLLADDPAVTSLSPPGFQRGTEVELLLAVRDWAMSLSC